MALKTDDPEIDSLAEELVELTGKPLEEAVKQALIDQVTRQREVQRVLRVVREISEHFTSLPVLDSRTPDEILGYDENGLPT